MKLDEVRILREPMIKGKDLEDIFVDFWIHRGKSREEAKKLYDDFACTINYHTIQQMEPRITKLNLNVLLKFIRTMNITPSMHGDDSWAPRGQFNIGSIWPISFKSTWDKMYATMGVRPAR